MAAPYSDSSKHDTPKPNPTVRRSTKAKTGEDRANDIAMALRSNPKEVRIINSGLENNGQILAGYLNLKDTMALRGYLSQKPVMQILLPWPEGREKKFGCDIAVKNPTWPREKIFSYIYEPGAVSSEDFEKGLPLDEHKWPRKGITRGLISWIVTMYKLITHAGEKMFTSTSLLDPDSKDKYLGGFHPEDYHRAYNLLKFHWRESSEARKSKGSAPRKQNLQSKAPEFLADADYRLVRDEESHQLTAVNPALVDFLQREDDSGYASNDDAGLEVGHRNELQEAEALEKFELGFEDMFKNTPSKLPPIKMAMLEPEVQRAVLVNIARKAKVLWPLSADRLSPPASMTLELATEHIRRGALEATFNTETNFTEDDVKRFWNLQITLNNASSIPPHYSICANLLHLDPQRPTVESRTLLPHQVTGVAWLLLMLAGPFHFGLLSDDVGLGKTTTILSYLSLRATFARRAELRGNDLSWPISMEELTVVNLLKPGPFRPTLVLFPSNGALVWKQEIRKFTNLRPYFYMGSAYHTKTRDDEQVLSSKMEELKSWIAGLDPEDPMTASIVVFSTYATWHKRSLFFDQKQSSKREGKIGAQHTGTEDNEPESEGLEDDDPEIVEEQLRSLRTRADGLFGLFICDEAHKLKTIRTRTHQSICLCRPTELILVTATPTINKPIDLYGILSLFAGVLTSRGIQPSTKSLELSDFDKADDGIKLTEVNLIDMEKFAGFVHPDTFRRLAGAGPHMPPEIAGRLLPPILRLIQLRRVKGQDMEVEYNQQYTIGAGIPAYCIVTVELQMTKEQESLYQAGHRNMAPTLSKGKRSNDLGKTEGKINMAAHRWLCLISLNPAFERIKSKVSTSANKLQFWYTHEDYGATFYHKATRLERWYPAYRDRVSWALYISGTSPKLQWLAGQIFRTCFVAKKKLLVFCSWPCSQWYVEMFLNIMGLKTLSIRACHNLSEREKASQSWNDADDEGQVLVTTYAVAGTSMNLHESCSDLVMLEPPEAANIALQCIGRVFRIGQTRTQNIWIITSDHTYDQIVQARCAQKMYGQIAGQAGIKPTQAKVDADVDSSDQSDNQEETLTANEQVVQFYTEMFGQRCPRDKWTNVKNLYEKDAFQPQRYTGSTKTAAHLARVENSLLGTSNAPISAKAAQEVDAQASDQRPPSSQRKNDSRPSKPKDVGPKRKRGSQSGPEKKKAKETH